MATFVEGEDSRYPVEDITAVKRVFGKFYFRVKWKDYDSSSDDTWEPIESFQRSTNFDSSSSSSSNRSNSAGRISSRDDGGSSTDSADSDEEKGCRELVESLQRQHDKQLPTGISPLTAAARKCDESAEGTLQLLREEDSEQTQFGFEDLLAAVEGSTRHGELQQQLSALSAPTRRAAAAVAAAAEAAATGDSDAAEAAAEAAKQLQLDSGVLPERLPMHKQQLQLRKQQFDFAQRDASKWIPLVQQQRQRQQQQFGYTAAAAAAASTRTVQQAAALMRPQGFEQALLDAVNSCNTEQQQLQQEQALAPADPIRRRQEQQQAARLRFLLSQEHRRLHRLKRIKAKEGRKKRRQLETRQQQQLLERLQQENPELAQQLQQQLQQQHAQQRLLRQQNARAKWARIAQRFGGRDMQAEISRQQQRGLDDRRALEKAAKGQQETDESESDGSGSAEEDIEDEARTPKTAGEKLALLRSAAAATTATRRGTGDEDAETPELPNKGLFALPFLRNGIEKARQEAAALKAKIERRRQQRAAGIPSSSSSGSSSGEEEEEDASSDSGSGESEGEGSDEVGEGMAAGSSSNPAAAAAKLRAAAVRRGMKRRKEARAGVAAACATATAILEADQQQLKEAEAYVASLLDGGGGLEALMNPTEAVAEVKGPCQQQQQQQEEKEQQEEQQLPVQGGKQNGEEAENEGLHVSSKAAIALLSRTLEQQKAEQQEQRKKKKKQQQRDYAKEAANKQAEAEAHLKRQREGHCDTSPSNPWLQQQKKSKGGSNAKAAPAPVAEGKSEPFKTLQDGLQDFLQSVADDAGAPDEDADATDPACSERKLEKRQQRQHQQQRREDQGLLVQQAFVEGDEEAMFRAEAAEEAAEGKEEDSSFLPGWGTWAGAGAKKPRRRATAGAAAAAVAAPAVGKALVVLNTKDDKKSSKYFVSQLPKYVQPEEYAAKMRQAVGPEWNSAMAHRRLIAPRVDVRVGAVVPPLQSAKLLEPEARETLLNLWTLKGSKKKKSRVRL
ncbi:plectin [Cyclospora cayetanensis]|uniref:Plectin n=1 Tax=Cyclospora cayetanensis TaxID=88456 RepID=A0A6P6RZC4_9EIME|nr:plectin [Cyclospora cayetanensis]